MHCEQRANYVLDCHLRTVEPRVSPANTRLSDAPNLVQTICYRLEFGESTSTISRSVYDCHLDNISASGLYLRLPRRMKFSSTISLVVRLLNGPVDGMVAAIKGTVMREELESDGHRGIGIRIVEHEFI